MSDLPMPPEWVQRKLRDGLVIPAHPLALTDARRLDECRQRALTRYYHAAKAGGLAVGVHTTQFAIRERKHGLLVPVLSLAAETARGCDKDTGRQTVLIAGICGPTAQALVEARLARELGYHACLLSLAGLPTANETELLTHCREVSKEIALMGFYLQPAVGGRVLSLDFWWRFATIPNVVAIKIAPFNRYQTLDVIRAVAEAGRADEIALYTGNDDHILLDLLTQYEVPTALGTQRMRIVGGLLGHWAFGTLLAGFWLAVCKKTWAGNVVSNRLLTLAANITDCNAAVFDAAHHFAGCIPGINEMLRRQGLLANNLCLDPREVLSAGQAEEIDRIQQAYPHLDDSEFIAAHRAEWLD